MTDSCTIKKRIQKLRSELNMSQSEVSRNLGINLSLYQRYEYGQSQPNVGRAIRIAEILQTTPQAIWG